jgi:arginine utilization regulatory protein
MLRYEDLYKEKLFEKIIDRSNDGINVVDEEGKLVYVNKISADYTGTSPEKMIGRHISNFYPKAVLLQVLENKYAVLDKKIHFVKNKKYVVSSYPIYIHNQFKGAFSIFKDVQEIDDLNKKVKYLELHLSINKPEDNFTSVIGNMGSLKELMVKAKRTVGSLAGPRHSIIIGESGTGKTMLANLIYKYAREVGVINMDAPFIEVNCGQFTNADIAAVEIFGSEEGAYTGSKQKKGLFEQAHGGILFLDEAHALENYQTMLLKAVESNKIRRIGGNREIEVDVIIIAASTKNLKREMLPELYQRLAQYELYIPSLKERNLEEKISLFNHFVDKYVKAVEELHGVKYIVNFEEETKKAIIEAQYPRNIRQLRDVVNFSIDGAAPLITDVKDEDIIKVNIKKEHLPFYISEETVLEEKCFINEENRKIYDGEFEKSKNDNYNRRKDIIDDKAALLIKEYNKQGYGPRIIAKKLKDENYEIEYYKVAYFLKKMVN